MPFDGIIDVGGGQSVALPTYGQERFDWERDFHFYPNLLALDAAPSLFFQRELEHIIPELFEFEFAKINARSLFPIDRSAGGAVKTITWRQFTKTGQAGIIADYADDINVVNAFGEEFTTNVRGIAAAAKWSIQEIRAAQAHNRPLERMFAEAAREAMLREENRIAFLGDAAFGLQGLGSASAVTGIPRNALPNGAWTTATTGADIVEDMNFVANTVVETTGDVEIPTRMLLPTAQYNIAATTQHSATATDTTALRYFLNNQPYIREVVPVREMATAFGAPAILAYDPNPSKLRMQVPLDIEQFAPQQKGLAIHVIWHMRVGGLTIHKPASLHVGTGL